MLLKVKHSELREVKNVLVNDGELIDEEINNLRQQLEKLKGIWQGQDSDFFCNNLLNYFEKMKSIPNSMRTLADFINKANNRYAENDEMFTRELQMEVDNYE